MVTISAFKQPAIAVAMLLVMTTTTLLINAGEMADSTVWLDDVVTTATRTPARQRDVASNVTVMTRDEIQASAASTVDELLKQIPGFTLLRQESSFVGHPTTQGPSLRGIGGTAAGRTLVLLDGIPINDPLAGWVYWGRISKESIERIEVVRGGSSSVWGNRAFGGVINIITRAPTERTYQIAAKGGNLGILEFDGFGAEVVGPLTLSVSGNYFTTDGYVRTRRNQRGAVDEKSDASHKSLMLGASYAASEDVTVFLQGSTFSEDRHGDTDQHENATDLYYIRGGADINTGDGSNWQINAFAHKQDFESAFTSVAAGRNTFTPAVDQFDVPTDSLGANLVWSKDIALDHTLSIGTDFQWIDGEIREEGRFVGGQFTRLRTAGGEQYFSGVFLQDAWSPSDRWQVVTAARFDYYRNFNGFRGEQNIQTGAVTRDESFSSQDESTFNPSVGLTFAATDSLSLRSSAYGGYRAPTINELYRGFFSGGVRTDPNPRLESERLVGGEIGADYEITESLFGRITGFWVEVKDPVTNVTITPTVRQRDNLGRVRSKGIELELEYRPNTRWKVSGSYMYDDARVVSAPNEPQTKGKRVPHAPKHHVVLQLAYTNPELISFSIQGRYVGNRFEDDVNTLDLDDFFVLDATASRELRGGVEVFLSMENLLDREYEVSRSGRNEVRNNTPFIVQTGIRVTF